MKRIYLHILVTMMATLTLAACDKEDAELKVVSDYPSFSATIEGSASRASETSWDKKDKIGITVTEGIVSGGNPSGTVNNICHSTTNGDGIFTVDNAKYQIIFTDKKPVKFVAYYPQGTLSTSGSYNGKISTYANSNISQTLTNQKKFDYLWAEGVGSKSAPDVKFNFSHMMSKITFVFQNGEGVDVSQITAYKLSGLYLRGLFDPLTGMCEITAQSTTTTTLTLTNFNNAKVAENVPAPSIIVFPQTLESTTVELTVTAANIGIGSITGNITFKDTKLEPGKNYQFVIKVNKTGLAVQKASITGWNDLDQGDEWEVM